MPQTDEVIHLSDSVRDILWKMSQGNPGAITVLCEMVKQQEQIDPDGLPTLGAILQMDTLGIRGPLVWMLYKDVCHQDLVRTIALLRAWQLGFVSRKVLLAAINSYGQGIDTTDLLTRVKARLPRFGQTPPDKTPEAKEVQQP